MHLFGHATLTGVRIQNSVDAQSGPNARGGAAGSSPRPCRAGTPSPARPSGTTRRRDLVERQRGGRGSDGHPSGRLVRRSTLSKNSGDRPLERTGRPASAISSGGGIGLQAPDARVHGQRQPLEARGERQGSTALGGRVAIEDVTETSAVTNSTLTRNARAPSRRSPAGARSPSRRAAGSTSLSPTRLTNTTVARNTAAGQGASPSSAAAVARRHESAFELRGTISR